MRLDQEGGDRGEASGGGSPTRLKILSIATLWPNVLSPQQGAHAERRLRLLQELGGAHVRVVAPIANRDENARGLRRRVFAPGRRESAVPELEKRASIVIHHPHFWDLGSASRRVLGVRRGLISEAAETLGRRFHQAAVNRMVQRLWRRFGPFDLIDAHGLGVDGAAAQALAAQLGTPFMATVYAGAERLRAATGGARRRLMKVTEAAAVTLAQGEDQAEALLAMGVDRSRLCVIRPGVDLERFKPTADEAERRKLKAGCGAPEDAPLILSIPGAAPMDEHARAIVAVAETPDAHL